MEAPGSEGHYEHGFTKGIMILALDTISDSYPLPSGVIVGLNPTVAGLRDAGFPEATYTGQRLVEVNTATSAWDQNCTTGWYWQDSQVRQFLQLTNADKVQRDADLFTATCTDILNNEIPLLFNRAKFDTRLDSGFSWIEDELNGFIKPWVRLIAMHFEEQRASDTPDPTAYTPDLEAFHRMAVTPGVLGFNSLADRKVWRSLRLGREAWEYDLDTNGKLADSMRVVTYPTGLTVATWSATLALRNLMA